MAAILAAGGDAQACFQAEPRPPTDFRNNVAQSFYQAHPAAVAVAQLVGGLRCRNALVGKQRGDLPGQRCFTAARQAKKFHYHAQSLAITVSAFLAVAQLNNFGVRNIVFAQ